MWIEIIGGTLSPSKGSPYSGENSHIGAFNFYPIFIPLFECQVSGVSVQDMRLRLPFLTPET